MHIDNDMNLVLDSERLLLRPHRKTDLDIEIEISTDPEVMKFVGDVETEDQVARNMPNYVRRCAGGCIGIWSVIERSTEDKLGIAVLLPLPIEEDDTNWDLVVGDELPDGEIEIGYMLKRSAWGKGYATEATKRLLKFAFEESPLQELVATTDPENAASQRVLEKCGLVYEGMRRAYAVECSGFRITRQQWLKTGTG
jgi:RimJ/RimL family protein N-acetyltransferase